MIFSLPFHCWVHCLQFLSPQEMAIASSSLCRSLSYVEGGGEGGDPPSSSSSTSTTDRCRTAGEVASYIRIVDIFSSLSSSSSSSSPISLWPSERWTRLYATVLATVSEINRVLTAYCPAHVDEDVDLTGHLLFGSPPSHRTLRSLQFSGPPLLANVDFGSACGTNLVGTARIVTVASRIAGIGLWRTASDLLLSHLRRRGRGRGREREEVGNDLNTTEEKEDDLEEDVEISILRCNFIVDRLYSSTYVSESASDAEDLARALVAGRSAVRRSPFPTTELTDNAASSSASELTSPPPPPPPPTNTADAPYGYDDRRTLSVTVPCPSTLYGTDAVLRAAHARLALGRCLGLLAQHVGLGASPVPDMPGAAPEGRGMAWRLRPRRRRRDPPSDHGACEGYFREGAEALDLSLGRLRRGATTSRDWDRVVASTLACRGELFYCASSVSGGGRRSLPVRGLTDEAEAEDEEGGANDEADDPGRRLRIGADLVRISVSNLAESFCFLQTRINARYSGEENGGNSSLDIRTMCNDPSISSEMLLIQANTAKDLGKALDFHHRHYPPSLIGADDDDGDHYHELDSFLNYTLVVHLEMFGPNHPSTKNVRRLMMLGWMRQNVSVGNGSRVQRGFNHNYNHFESDDFDENVLAGEVNRWLNDSFQNGRMISRLITLPLLEDGSS